jgi:hypothetical protein
MGIRCTQDAFSLRGHGPRINIVLVAHAVDRLPSSLIVEGSNANRRMTYGLKTAVSYSGR